MKMGFKSFTCIKLEKYEEPHLIQDKKGNAIILFCKETLSMMTVLHSWFRCKEEIITSTMKIQISDIELIIATFPPQDMLN